ncbi:hypothetical protein FRC17_010231 [Serendipita sp. 399]|nr:hypothetical protein FRC17_010231 [Serendipita sp. 399]
MAHNGNNHPQKPASLPALDTYFEKRPLSASSEESTSSASSSLETPIKEPEPVLEKPHRHKKHHHHHHHHHHHKKHRSKRVNDYGITTEKLPSSTKKEDELRSPTSADDRLSLHSSLSPAIDLEDPQNQPNLYEDASNMNNIIGLGPAPRRSFFRRHMFVIVTTLIGLLIVGIIVGVVVVKFAVIPNQRGHIYRGGVTEDWNYTLGPNVMMGPRSSTITDMPTPTPTPL